MQNCVTCWLCFIPARCFLFSTKSTFTTRQGCRHVTFQRLGPKWVICVMSVSDKFLKLGVGGGLS